MNGLSWVPVRRGPLYCSPACGFKCTWEGYEAAVREASALVARLGPGWEPDVWENVRWNYRVKTANNLVKVHATRENHYVAYVSSTPSPGGEWVGHGVTPQEALLDAGRQLGAQAERMQKAIDTLERLIAQKEEA